MLKRRKFCLDWLLAIALPAGVRLLSFEGIVAAVKFEGRR